MKISTLFVIIILASSPLPTVPLAAASGYTLYVLGNANMDETVDEMDIAYLEGIIDGTNEVTELADANYDGNIDAQDLDQIGRIIDGSADSLTVIDSANRTVTVSLPVKAAAGLHTSPCREFCMLGVEDRVVAVTSYIFDDPLMYPRLLDKADIGTIYEPNFEVIAEANPDLLVTTPGTYLDSVLETVEPMGITVVSLDLAKPFRYDEELALLGMIMGKEVRARDFVDWRSCTMDLIVERTSSLGEDKARVFSTSISNVWKGETEFAPGLLSSHMILENGGAEDISSGYPSGQKLGMEWILDQYPDAIVLASYNTEDGLGYTITDDDKAAISWQRVMESDTFSKTRAAKEGRVLILSYYGTASGGQDPLGAAYLARWLYPELFEDLNPADLHREYLEEWMGIPYQGVYSYPPP
jgi:iron complex transport system substrate-binding protein